MYSVHCLVAGFPAKSRTHAGMGWSSVYLVSDGRRNILVDTGPPAYTSLLQAGLAGLGLSAADITDVLVTHLHWDHVSNFTMFENASIVVSGVELDWAARQPAGTPFVPDLHVARLATMDDRLQLVRDGAHPMPGVTVLATPGHTPGHVAYRVEGKDHNMLFAGDAVKNRHELRTGVVDSTLDRAASERSVLMLRQQLTGSDVVLVPGHDVRLAMVGEQVAALEPQDCEVTVFLGDGGEPSTRTLVP